MGATTAPRARTSRVVLHQDPGSTGWWVSVPALPGCFTQGDTRTQALERVREAIEVHIAGLLADGEPVPEESAVEMDAVEVEA
ncbi:MAG TPA: type II toxin-antitoxin system HicB family antitoxin [Bacillota bacterium]|nr:type II toxin-antitoxin system HicB family antitoxin [Bacillota bacterium]